MPLTTYAEIDWVTENNASVTSSVSSGGAGCDNNGKTPCFSLQLSVYNYVSSNSTWDFAQWLFFVDHNTDIVVCATDGYANEVCSSSNECTFTLFPSDDFVADTFYVIFTSATSYSFELSNSANGTYGCTPGSPAGANLSGLSASKGSWEVSTGVGFSNDACAVWSTSVTTENWAVEGFAPVSITTTGTPATCTASGGTNYSGGSLYFTAGGASLDTAEAGNLNLITGTYSNADSLAYTQYD
jgi:hypothetical protein